MLTCSERLKRNVRSPRRRKSQCPEGGGRVALRNSGWSFKPLSYVICHSPIWPPFITPYTPLNSVISTSLMSLLSLASQNPRESLDNTPCCHGSLPCIIDVDIKINHQRIQTTNSHASHCHHYNCCHYCNVDFVLFHNVTCYNNSLLSCIHANTT
jgi:hypothetical protein